MKKECHQHFFRHKLFQELPKRIVDSNPSGGGHDMRKREYLYFLKCNISLSLLGVQI